MCALVFCAVSRPKVPWSLGDHLPEGTVILEEVVDQSGMDSFFLVKAAYLSESHITQICEEYLLEIERDGDPMGSFAGLYSETHEIPWFPLARTTRTYSFCTKNPDGTQKEVTDLGYDAVLWVNDEDRTFILQLAAL